MVRAIAYQRERLDLIKALALQMQELLNAHGLEAEFASKPSLQSFLNRSSPDLKDPNEALTERWTHPAENTEEPNRLLTISLT